MYNYDNLPCGDIVDSATITYDSGGEQPEYPDTGNSILYCFFCCEYNIDPEDPDEIERSICFKCNERIYGNNNNNLNEEDYCDYYHK